ncbi:MAG: hypothetical protein ACHQAX_07610 [Gammaproteobacteria bacterium]
MKKLMLLGVDDERRPGKFRALNQKDLATDPDLENDPDLEDKTITLVFMDLDKPDIATECTLHLSGAFAYKALIAALKRHALAEINASHNTTLRKERKKNVNVVFNERFSVRHVSAEEVFESSLSPEIVKSGLSLKESVKEYTERKTIELTDEYKKTINRNKSIVEYFKDVEQIHFNDAAMFDEYALKVFVGQVLALAPNLKKIVVPDGVDPSLSAHYWSAIWGRKLEGGEPPVVTPNQANDDETRSISSNTSPTQLQQHVDEPVEDQLQVDEALEEQVWDDVPKPYTNIAKALACAVTVTAVAYRASKLEATPSQVFWAAAQAEGIARQVIRTASRVPFLPSAMSFAGAIANSTVVPVARGVVNYLGRGK